MYTVYDCIVISLLTVLYVHRMRLYIWWFLSQNYHVYPMYINGSGQPYLTQMQHVLTTVTTASFLQHLCKIRSHVSQKCREMKD